MTSELEIKVFLDDKYICSIALIPKVGDVFLHSKYHSRSVESGISDAKWLKVIDVSYSVDTFIDIAEHTERHYTYVEVTCAEEAE